jgi:hypothetical protein
MIKSYEITNFKAFLGSQYIPLRPITLVYGQNSSGKSSVLQSLLMLKQTIESVETPELLLVPKGPLVDLGGYREFINGHDVTRSFSFKASFPLKDLMELTTSPIVYALNTAKIECITMKIELAWDREINAVKLNALLFFVDGFHEPLFTCKSEKRKNIGRMYRSFGFFNQGPGSAIADSILRIDKLNKDHPFWVHLVEVSRKQLAQEPLNEIIHRKTVLTKRLDRVSAPEFRDLEDAAKKPTELRLEKELKEIETLINKISNYSLSDALMDIESVGRKTAILCRNFLPIGVIRQEGYEAKNATTLSEYLGPGYNSIFTAIPSIVVAAAKLLQMFLSKMIYIGPLRDYPERHYIFSGNLAAHVGKSGKMVPDILFKNKALLKQVNDQLESFGLDYSLEVSSISDNNSDLNDVFSLRLLDKRTQIQASILDVGFGISQVLPIIVQSMLSRNKTLCIEQPEIHLHPRLQADLGALFAKCIKEPFSNQFIVETHSQHMILRIQRLIRQKIISHNDIAVLYVDKTTKGSKCLELRLDQDGDFIDEWPNGFFEEGYKEIFS